MLTRRPWSVSITGNLQLLVLESESSLVTESQDQRRYLHLSALAFVLYDVKHNELVCCLSEDNI